MGLLSLERGFGNMLIILDRKQNPVGIASNTSPKGLPYFNDIHKEVVKDNLNVLDFEVPINHPSFSLLEEEGYVIYTDLDNRKQLFAITEMETTYGAESTMTVYCEHVATNDLNDEYVAPVELKSQTLKQIVSYVLTNAMNYDLGDVALLGVKDFKFDNWITIKEALGIICKEFEVEIEYETIYNGTEVERNVINVVEKRGSNTGVSLDVRRDVKEIKKTVNSSELYTGVIAVGKDGLTLRNYTGPYEAKHPVTDYYISNLDTHAKYHKKNFKHKMGKYEDGSENQVELYNNVLKFVKEHGKTKDTYSVDIVILERLTGYGHKRVRIGDTITIRDFYNNPDNPFLLEARVIELERSRTNPQNDKVVLGDYNPLTFTRSSEIIELQRKIRNNESKWEDLGEVVFKSATPPPIPEMNQLWLKIDVVPNVLRRWDGYGWDDVTPTEAGQIGAFPTEDANGLIDRVDVIDNRTTDIKIIDTVVSSDNINTLFNNKANVEDLSGLATGEQLEEVRSNMDAVDKSIRDYTDSEVNKMTSSFGKTAQDIRAEFTSSKGVNILRNSIGFAEHDFWSINGSLSTRKDEELETLGYGSGWYSPIGDSGYIEQVVNIPTSRPYTVSFFLNKSVDDLTLADAVVEIDVNGQTLYRIGKQTASGNTSGYQAFSHTFESTYSQATIRVKIGINAEATITALMLNQGEFPFSWSHHAEEIYSTNVLMNQLGIRVKNENTKGYTQITPEEFGGYAMVDGVMKRIFVLSGENTEVYSLHAEKEIDLNPIKMISIKSVSRNGIAFIPSE